MTVNPNTRYSDEELQEFKVLIDDKLAKARKELDFMQEQMIELNENGSNQQSGDLSDDGTLHSELEMLNNMMVRQHQFIRNLENALIRIHNKTYGICTVTGQLIDKKRLILVPHATKSVEAKNSQPMTSENNNKASVQGIEAEAAKAGIISRIFRKNGAGKKEKETIEDDDVSDMEEYHNPILGINKEFFGSEK